MKSYGIDVLIISSRDEFLNEYVDKNASVRVYLTDFLGTAGELIITLNEAFLLVDGRYHIQAENQVDTTLYNVVKVGLDENGQMIDEYLHERLIKVIASTNNKSELTVGIDPRQFSIYLFKLIKENLYNVSPDITFKKLPTDFFSKILPSSNKFTHSKFKAININISGLNTNNKLDKVLSYIKSNQIDACLLTKLDDIAYLLNINGFDINYNSTIRAVVLINAETLFLFSNINAEDLNLLEMVELNTEYHKLNEFIPIVSKYIQDKKLPMKIAFEPSSTNLAQYDFLTNFDNVELIEFQNNPIKILKSIKNCNELSYIQTCFNKADKVFNELINWINSSLLENKIISEGIIKDKLIEIFKSYGAQRLSFEPIVAIAENSAIVHYTESSYSKILSINDLVLIDSGAYFDNGYATDLTRTFIAGDKSANATQKQKNIYTIVLKASINGLTAEIYPEKNNGTDLDSIVRNIIKESNYNFNHGTGHGIGRLVHEYPPSIASRMIPTNILKENMLFTIEPGIYIEGWGGVRIENVVTLVPHSEKNKAEAGCLQVKCLTFANLDYNLIDLNLLTQEEKDFLSYYSSKGKNLC